MIAEVIVDISNSEVDKIFDYTIPSKLELKAGDRVLVPFGNRSIEGFCINIKESSSGAYSLKDIITKLDEKPLITTEMLRLMEFMKDKFYIRFVDSLRLFIPNKLRGSKVKKLIKTYIAINANLSIQQIKDKVSPRAKSQLAIIERLGNGEELLTVLNNEYSNSAVKALLKLGILTATDREIYRTPYKNVLGNKSFYNLTDLQTKAIKQIKSATTDTILLHGVTGSGKTEVYMNLICDALELGKSAIMLVPEISLTPQILKLFRARFGDTVAMLHSGLSDGERYDEWRRISDGEAMIAIGARSAVFAPMENVGIIIIDEEHDSSYISESNPRFNTIDIARFRASYNKCKVILGSATPSVESYNNAINNTYTLVNMEERISKNGMPVMKIINMTNEVRSGNFDILSREFKELLIKTIDEGNQAILFLNRRGFASFLMCKECGYVAKCSDCEVSLTYHSEDNLLKCHYCGKRYKVLTECPNCHSSKIKLGKIGTEQVVKKISEFLPDTKVLRMDNDTTGTKTAYLDILGAFGSGEAQILVGTQMIAKGHDFPNVTLVGVLDADMSLYFSDYRAIERTYQLITQVSGRAGRSEKKGQVVVQTYSPNHYIYKYLQTNNYRAFFDKELNTRQLTKFPPFTTIIRVLISAVEESKCVDLAKQIYTHCKQIKVTNEQEFEYLQAMKAPLARLQTKFRYQIIMRIKRDKEKEIIKKLYNAIDECGVKGATAFVEINPQSMS